MHCPATVLSKYRSARVLAWPGEGPTAHGVWAEARFIRHFGQTRKGEGGSDDWSFARGISERVGRTTCLPSWLRAWTQVLGLNPTTRPLSPPLVISGWEPSRTERPLTGFFATWNLSLEAAASNEERQVALSLRAVLVQTEA